MEAKPEAKGPENGEWRQNSAGDPYGMHWRETAAGTGQRQRVMTGDEVRDLTAQARETGAPLRADKNDRVRLAGWLLGALADELDRDAAQLAGVRAVFDAFDWEFSDRQYALEQIEMIVAGDPPAAAAG